MPSQTAGGGSHAIQRTVVTVVLPGEEYVSVTIKPVAMVTAERHYKGNIPQVEGTLYAAWWQLNREGRTDESFGDWLDMLEDVDIQLVDPTSATAATP